MSSKEKAAAAEPATETKEASLLDLALKATKTEETRAKDMLGNLAKWALDGTVSWDKNVTRSIQKGMEAIDMMLSKQLSAIMHAPEFQKLEGSWRGLHYLVMNSRTSSQLK